MKQPFHTSLLAMIFLTMTGCVGFGQPKKQLTTAEFEQAIDTVNSQLLDVRTAEEFRNGHIAHSLQANWNDKDQFLNRIQYLDKNKPLYVYCASGGRSRAAAEWFRSNGFSNVYELSGGFIKWKADNKPVEGMPAITQMTWEAYTAAVSNSGLTLVDVGASWCPPCRKMEPVLQQVQTAMTGKVKLVKIDAGVQTALLTQLQVSEFPTLILYKNGKEVWRKTGVVEWTELKKEIDKQG